MIESLLHASLVTSSSLRCQNYSSIARSRSVLNLNGNEERSCRLGIGDSGIGKTKTRQTLH